MKLFKIYYKDNDKYCDALVVARDIDELKCFINYRQKIFGEFKEVCRMPEEECLYAFNLYDITEIEDKAERAVMYLKEIWKVLKETEKRKGSNKEELHIIARAMEVCKAFYEDKKDEDL